MQHFTRGLPPETPAARHLRRFQTAVMDAHLAHAGPVQQPWVHIDVRRLAGLAGRFGGHAVRPLVGEPLPPPPAADEPPPPPPPPSFHDAAYYGSFGAVWHYIHRWIPPLRHIDLARRGAAGGALPFQTSLAAAFDRIAAAHRLVSLRPDRQTLLPADARFPSLFSRLDDGRLTPATAPLGAVPPADDDLAGSIGPEVLHDLDSFELTALPHAQRAASAVVSSLEFLSLYDSATSTGRARLLDGSSARGPHSWLRRVPLDPLASDFFSFFQPEDFSSALALDLLICPPIVPGSEPHCVGCAAAGRPSAVGECGRHYITCPHGLRLHTEVHDPVVETLGALCEHAVGTGRVLFERSGRGGQRELRQTVAARLPAGLGHRPDLVLLDFDGPHTVTLIDVKTVESTCPSHIQSDHTDRVRQAALTAIQERTPATYFPSAVFQGGRPPPRVRLITFAVSTGGALGTEAQTLIRSLVQRVGRSVPTSLMDEATWATPTFGPFVRMAICMSVRRSLAASLRHHWGSLADAAAARPVEAVAACEPPEQGAEPMAGDGD